MAQVPGVGLAGDDHGLRLAGELSFQPGVLQRGGGVAAHRALLHRNAGERNVEQAGGPGAAHGEAGMDVHRDDEAGAPDQAGRHRLGEAAGAEHWGDAP